MLPEQIQQKSRDVDSIVDVTEAQSCAPGEGLRILFVDDDPILREFAIANLSEELGSVLAVADGAAALAAFASQSPDVILLGLQLPDLSAVEVLRRMGCDGAQAVTPALVMVDRESLDAVGEALLAGAAGFVVKPLNWRLLRHQLLYAHQAACRARALDERRQAAAERLRDLAAQSARFLALALDQSPELRPSATALAQAVQSALAG